jgi:hypothetical protein
MNKILREVCHEEINGSSTLCSPCAEHDISVLKMGNVIAQQRKTKQHFIRGEYTREEQKKE